MPMVVFLADIPTDLISVRLRLFFVTSTLNLHRTRVHHVHTVILRHRSIYPSVFDITSIVELCWALNKLRCTGWNSARALPPIRPVTVLLVLFWLLTFSARLQSAYQVHSLLLPTNYCVCTCKEWLRPQPEGPEDLHEYNIATRSTVNRDLSAPVKIIPP